MSDYFLRGVCRGGTYGTFAGGAVGLLASIALRRLDVMLLACFLLGFAVALAWVYRQIFWMES